MQCTERPGRLNSSPMRHQSAELESHLWSRKRCRARRQEEGVPRALFTAIALQPGMVRASCPRSPIVNPRCHAVNARCGVSLLLQMSIFLVGETQRLANHAWISPAFYHAHGGRFGIRCFSPSVLDLSTSIVHASFVTFDNLHNPYTNVRRSIHWGFLNEAEVPLWYPSSRKG